MEKNTLLMLLYFILTLFSNSTSAQVGIGTNNPETMLDIIGSLRLDHPSKGQGKILRVENNGYVKWSGIEYYNLVKGDLHKDGIIKYEINDIPQYTNATITLPPGSFLVTTIMILSPVHTYNFSSASFTTVYFSDSSTNSIETSDYVEYSARYISGKLTGPSVYGLIDGSVVITNNTSSDKTYHLWAIKKVYKTDSSVNDSSIDLRYFASGTQWGENSIYAVPITF